MKKNLLCYLLLFLPLLTLAQSEAGLLKDYAKDVHNMTTPLKFSDKLNIITINGDNNQVQLSAIDNDMNVVWSADLDGYSLSVGKFKGKILVVASTDYGFVKSKNNTYKAYLVDPASGKVLTDKIIYDNDQEYAETPYFFQPEDGSFFKIAVRQTNLTRKMHVGLPGMLSLFTINKLENDANATQDITVIEFDDKLNATNTFHPAISDDMFITMECNYAGSLFIAWYSKDGNVNVLKYPLGKKAPSVEINESFDMHNGSSKRNAAANFKFYPSVKNQDQVFFSVLYKNPDNYQELTVSKLDFVKKTSTPVTEVFTRTHLKELEKAYQPVNKKLDKPFNISDRDLEVRGISELKDRVLVFMSSRSSTSSTINPGAVYVSEGSFIINGYDLDLNLKYNQLFPSGYAIPGFTYLGIGYHKDGDNIHVVAPYKKDGAIYGTMNISTGDWSDMVQLPKKKLSGTDFPVADKIFWFDGGFTLPYTRQRGMTKVNQDISLQQFTN